MMTRRRIVFTDPSGRCFITPEFNGDKTEFEQFGMGDQCTATWEEILAMFKAVSTLDEFKAANYQAQGYYISSIARNTPPEPVTEINAGVIIADEVIYLTEVNTR
jgi:hypothetical protein